MIRLSSSGSTVKTSKFLDKLLSRDIYKDLNRYGQIGATALARATPTRTGKTANSWTYRVIQGRNGTTIMWLNNNVNKGAQIAILLQYGHGTGTGGYVAGYDYINPAIRPIFDQIADDVWKKVING